MKLPSSDIIVSSPTLKIYLSTLSLKENDLRFYFWYWQAKLTTLLLLGMFRQPKYGHLKDLHRAIKLCEHALVTSDPTVTSLGAYEQVGLFVYSMIFFTNRDDVSELNYGNSPGSRFLFGTWKVCCFSCKLPYKFCSYSGVQQYALHSASLVNKHPSRL